MERVILVDKDDHQIRTREKMKAHEVGELHRAFSVLVFNEQGEILLQRRALSKYHSGGLWTNACCSHPRPGEEVIAAARRRLKEELGFECELEERLSFVYRVKLGELVEHEFDHVLVGEYEGKINFNKDEVMETKWMKLTGLKEDLTAQPQNYTEWFKMIIRNYPNKLAGKS